MHDNIWLKSAEDSRRRSLPSDMAQQPSLYPLRIGTRYPPLVNGADISFCCEAELGGTYFCKNDKDQRPIRATEWLFTHLARQVDLVTPECAVLEDPVSGETVFGSLNVKGAASPFEAKVFLGTPLKGDFGQPSEWPGRYLSGLYVFDLFVGNIDRSLEDFFILQDGYNRQLCSFDFASAELGVLSSRKFPVATTATIKVGRFLRSRHRFFDRAANEMVDRIAAVPADVIASILKPMPEDWLGKKQREDICELWSEKRFGGRLLALRTGIADESLL